MITFLKYILITYVVLSYIVGVVALIALFNLKKKFASNGQQFPAKISYAKIIPVFVFAPISLPILAIVVWRLKNKQR